MGEPHPSPHRWNRLRFTRQEPGKTNSKEGSWLTHMLHQWAYSSSIRAKVQKPWPLHKTSVLSRFFEFQAQVFFLATIAEELEKNSNVRDRLCTCFVKSQPFHSFALRSQSHSCIVSGAVSRVKLMDFALGTYLALHIQSNDHPSSQGFLSSSPPPPSPAP